MLAQLQWYNIAVMLREYLKSFRYKSGKHLFHYLVDRDEMKILVGSGNTGEYPALWILFGDESELEKQDSIGGATVQLWLDLYVKAEATPEYDFTNNLYQQMFKAEQELVYALREFNRELQKRGIGANTQIKAILSDGDENVSGNALNTAVHRIVVDINWRKSRN